MYRISFSGVLKRIDPQQAGDALAIAVAVALPWSSSITGILIVLWIVALLQFLSFSRVRTFLSDFLNAIRTPAGGLPLLLWLVAELGMLWADVSWHDRLHGLGSFNKLIVIPVLLVQFSRSNQARYALAGYLVSCTILLMLSWAFVLWPTVAWNTRFPGVPVKDYIAQSGEFVLCAFGSLHIGLNAFKLQRHSLGFAFVGLALTFLANVFYVATSRTELVVIPVLLVVFAIHHFDSRRAYLALAIGALFACGASFTSPYLHDRVIGAVQEIQRYQAGDSEASAGQHLSLLKRSIKIIGEAPVIGHGTGSITALFRQSTIGQTGADAIVSTNPHNQAFAVAIQLGMLGTIVLCAMWIYHAAFFWRVGWEGCIGTLLVFQNIVSSQFNSHLFDFTQGWTYVFGVGVIGGAVMQRKQNANTGLHASQK